MGLRNAIASRIHYLLLLGDRLRAKPGLLDRSQRRWREYEAPSGLTWGVEMTGDSLWDVYCKHHRFDESESILEVGPGYGRLLTTALEREIPFRDYIGLELSSHRTEHLNALLGNRRISFVCGDVMTYAFERQFDVVLCSATFEHLFPDFRSALENLKPQLSSGAVLFIDFIKVLRGLSPLRIMPAGFEQNDAYVRHYTADHLCRIFAETGFRVRALESCALGTAVDGKEIERTVVVANNAA